MAGWQTLAWCKAEPPLLRNGSTKYEAPNSKQIQKFKTLKILNLDIVSDFGFRISDFRCEAAAGVPLEPFSNERAQINDYRQFCLP
jgi:hypothetical protein